MRLPGNQKEWAKWKRTRYGFLLAADGCYSAVLLQEGRELQLLQVVLEGGSSPVLTRGRAAANARCGATPGHEPTGPT